MYFLTGKKLVAAILLLVVLGPIAVAQEADNKAAPQKASSDYAAADSNATGQAKAAAPAALLPGYRIGSDDVLAVHVWKEPDLSATVAVRPDGKITLPVIGDIEAAGLTPVEVQNDVQARLKAYVAAPEVTVIVQEVKSVKFNIVGDGIARPGSYELTPPMNVLDAIALAGGLKDFAKKTKIYVLRVGPDGTSTRIPFNYKEVTRGQKLSQNVELKPRDTVVVP